MLLARPLELSSQLFVLPGDRIDHVAQDLVLALEQLVQRRAHVFDGLECPILLTRQASWAYNTNTTRRGLVHRHSGLAGRMLERFTRQIDALMH